MNVLKPTKGEVVLTKDENIDFDRYIDNSILRIYRDISWNIGEYFYTKYW